MKMINVFGMIMAMIVFMAACGYGTGQTGSESNGNVDGNAGGSDDYLEGESWMDHIILKDPPALTVLYGQTEGEAIRGSYFWTYDNEDGTFMSVTADSAHPLDVKELLEPLGRLFGTSSHDDPFTAYLKFEVAPDDVTVRCWNETQWGNTEAESERVEVAACKEEEAGIAGLLYKVSLKEYHCIYEVTAQWNRSEHYYGTVSYSFYVTYP